jgi:UTP--glucose-1-phosphate uridylyltransferase
MADIEGELRAKMSEVSSAATEAFLFQYRKLEKRETGFIPESAIAPIEKLPAAPPTAPQDRINALVGQTVILKLNGGLGTGMGLEQAKSLLRVRGELTFLDIIVRQYLRLRFELGQGVELLMMNSFSTSADTREALLHYPELGDPANHELLQNKVPKISAETLRPVVWPTNPALEWCPPGHGDIYPALAGSGVLDHLLSAGKLFLFVSNADNLGATLDLAILNYFAESGARFLMEVTRRTAADRKGGHLARRRQTGRLLLRESAQCPEEDTPAFQDIDRYRFFNTNNLWIRLDALKEAVTENNGFIPLPLIQNQKTVDPRDKKSPKVYQLETAMGAAIESFAGAQAVEVPRDRFAPVKTTADLLAVRSDAYLLDDRFRLRLLPESHGQPPIISLSDDYKLVDALEQLVQDGAPSLSACRSLTIVGPWRFAPGVVIRQDVEFRNATGERKTIAAGQYENQTVG